MAKKKKKSTVGIFFSFFLKAIVIILGLVILAMGAYLVKYTLTEEDKASNQELDDNVLVDVDDDIFYASDTDTDEEEGGEELLFDGEGGEGDIKADEKIVVLNATETSGLAKAWQGKLAEAGFENIEIGNYFGNKLDTTRIVVMEEGKGENLKALVSNATLETGDASSIECDADVDGAKAFIIVGKSDDIVSQ